jgi:hypothetical protein
MRQGSCTLLTCGLCLLERLGKFVKYQIALSKASVLLNLKVPLDLSNSQLQIHVASN